MDAALVQAPQAGKVVRTPTGYTAFVPAPLPPDIAYDSSLVMALSRADAALSELSGLGRHLPNPHLLIAPYVRREAVLSSRIEGTIASLSDVLLEEVEPRPDRAPADVREVQNYVTALEYGVRRLQVLPLSLRLVHELHARLMEGVRGAEWTPGEFRRSQNWIGPPGSNPMTAPYVPPPPDEMMEALGDWERFLHQRDVMPDLVHCAHSGRDRESSRLTSIPASEVACSRVLRTQRSSSRTLRSLICATLDGLDPTTCRPTSTGRYPARETNGTGRGRRRRTLFC